MEVNLNEESEGNVEPIGKPVSAATLRFMEYQAKCAAMTPAEREAENRRIAKESAERERESRLKYEKDERLRQWGLICEAMGPKHTQKKFKDRELYGVDADKGKQQVVFDRVTHFCENLRENCQSGRNLILFGAKGCGKDFCLTHCLATAIMRCGIRCKWFNGMSLYRDIRDSMRPDSEITEAQMIHRMCEAPILAISDPLPPIGNLTPFQAETLVTVLDERYRFNRPTWLTINVTGRKEAEERMGALSIDRLLEDAEALFFDWPSYREYARARQLESATT